MAKCVDCRYSMTSGQVGLFRCDKHKAKMLFDVEQNACSDFDTEEDDSKSCYECDYFSENVFGAKCTKANKKINKWDRACIFFCE